MEAQEAAFNRVKELKGQYAMTKVNPAKMLDGLQKSHGNMVNQEMKMLSTLYTDTVKKLEPCVKGIRNWTASTMQAGSRELDILASDLQEQSAKLMDSISKLKLAIKETTTAKRKSARAELAIREKALRGFLNLDTPGVLAKWLFSVGAIRPLEEEGNQIPEWNIKMTMNILGGRTSKSTALLPGLRTVSLMVSGAFCVRSSTQTAIASQRQWPTLQNSCKWRRTRPRGPGDAFSGSPLKVASWTLWSPCLGALRLG